MNQAAPLDRDAARPALRISDDEGSWIAYQHSEVPSDCAFALVTAKNNWIPSSTWTQSMGEVPVGFFCDEPEATEALRRLCLVPHRPSSDASGIVYLVASCLKFYERTLPPLLKQLFDEGIPRKRIKVVVNGCEADRDETIDGIEHAFSRHDGWEYSTLYEGPLRWRFDYAFLMHDTNVILPGFRRSVETFNRHLPWDHLPASPLARCPAGPLLARLPHAAEPLAQGHRPHLQEGGRHRRGRGGAPAARAAGAGDERRRAQRRVEPGAVARGRGRLQHRLAAGAPRLPSHQAAQVHPRRARQARNL